MPNKKQILNKYNRNPKDELKQSNDGKICLVVADTKFELIIIIFITGSAVAYNLNTVYSTLNESANIQFIFTTTGPDATFYWTNSGTTNASDFVQNITSGRFITTGGSGSVTLTLVEDKFTEGSETVLYHVRTSSVSGSLVVSSFILVINDISIGEYFISSSASTVNEGTQLTFSVTTTAPDGELFWTGASTTNSSDFIQNINSGSFFTTSGTGSLVLNVENDILTEGIETFILQVRTNNFDGNVVATKSITINDTSTTQYSVSASTLNVFEGSPITFTFTTTGTDDTFNWSLDPVTFSIPGGGTSTHPFPIASDFDENTLSGSFVTTAGTGSVTLNVAIDAITEPPERFRFVVAGAASGPVVFISNRYGLYSSVDNVNEGSSVTFTFITEDPDDTFYWTNEGNSTASDFVGNATSGSFITTNGTGSIVLTTVQDLMTEGTETIDLRIRSGSYVGGILASVTVDINDTSQYQYSMTPSSLLVGEADTVTFTFTTNVADGTFYWYNAGTTDADDFIENITSGSFITVNGTGSMQLNLLEDNIAEDQETIVIGVRNTETGSALVFSPTVLVNNTSGDEVVITGSGPTPTTFKLATSALSIYEGSPVTFTFTTNAPDQTFYWLLLNPSGQNVPAAEADDSVEGLNSGSFATVASTGSFSLTAKDDLYIENTIKNVENNVEKFRVRIRTGSLFVLTVGKSPNI